MWHCQYTAQSARAAKDPGVDSLGPPIAVQSLFCQTFLDPISVEKKERRGLKDQTGRPTKSILPSSMIWLTFSFWLFPVFLRL